MRKPKIILIAHTKGGVSKSTTTLNLAVIDQARGHKVGLFDVDVGQSLSKWASVRCKLRPDLPTIPVAPKFGPTAHLEIQAEAASFDRVFIDAGGEGVGSPEIGLILTLADVLITPCRPSGADIVRLENIHGLLATARRFNPTLRALLVPTQASTNARANDVIDFYGKAAQFPGYTLAASIISQRTALSTWADTGEAITESKPADPKAIAEMTALYDEVFA